MSRSENVVALPEGRPSSGGGGNGGSGHGERLARIEARMEHVATREEIPLEYLPMMRWCRRWHRLRLRW